MTSAIVGARSPQQVAENAGGAGWRLSDDDWQTIDQLGRQAIAGIDPQVNIWGDPINWEA